jgi:hypothetical protein
MAKKHGVVLAFALTFSVFSFASPAKQPNRIPKLTNISDLSKYVGTYPCDKKNRLLDSGVFLNSVKAVLASEVSDQISTFDSRDFEIAVPYKPGSN